MMINLEDITKKYESLKALDNVNLHIEKGQRVSIFGHNGAGKTTLLRVIARLITPTSGRVWINSVPFNNFKLLKKIGFADNNTYFYESMTIRQNLYFYGAMYDMTRKEIDRRLTELLGLMKLADKKDQPIKSLSKGMKQKLVIIRALLHDPQILLLDEPYSGLDYNSAQLLKALLAAASEKTILIATHDFEYGIEEGVRVLIFNEGKLVDDSYSDGDVDNFRLKYGEITGYDKKIL